MPLFVLSALLGCDAAVTSAEDSAASGVLSVISPQDGAELVEGADVWLEVAAWSADGADADPADVQWSVHGTDWAALGNPLTVSDLPHGWGLLQATAQVDGQTLTAGIEVVVDDGGSGDTGSTDTDTGLGSTGIDHLLSLVYDPSGLFEARGYTDCGASFSAVLNPRTSGDLCPETDLTVDGSLVQDSGTCPPDLLSSIPDPIAYGIDATQPDGWGLWVPDEGSWYSIGVAKDLGGTLRLTTLQGVTVDGLDAGQVTWTFDFTP